MLRSRSKTKVVIDNGDCALLALDFAGVVAVRKKCVKLLIDSFAAPPM